MTKRVFIIHGWHGYPNEGWFPWLKQELENKGFEVHVPEMPETDVPVISKWINHLNKIVKNPDKETYFVGHSIGCQAILRYIEKLENGIKIGGAVLVAPWMTLDENTYKEEGEEGRKIAKPWIETSIDFSKILNHTDRFTVIFSDNDPYVPLQNATIFEEELFAQTFIEYNKGHFSGEDNIKELPIVLEELLKMN